MLLLGSFAADLTAVLYIERGRDYSKTKAGSTWCFGINFDVHNGALTGAAAIYRMRKNSIKFPRL